MLDPDIIRVIGDSASMLEFVGVRLSFASRGEERRFCKACRACPPPALCRSGDDSRSVGGPAGNLKVCEKEFEAFRVMVGTSGVLGLVVVPGRLLPGRIGKAKSVALS